MAQHNPRSFSAIGGGGKVTTKINGKIVAANQVLANSVSGASFVNAPQLHPAITVDGTTDVEVKAEGQIIITDKDGNAGRIRKPFFTVHH